MFSGLNTRISGFLMLNTEDIDITPSKPAGHQVTTMSASLYYSAWIDNAPFEKLKQFLTKIV